MKPRSRRKRRVVNGIVQALSGLASLFGCFMLSWILLVIIQHGAAALNWDFFTQMQPPPGEEGGGMGPAIVGTLIMIVMAAIVGMPVGLMAGVFLAEYTNLPKLTGAIRYACDVLMGVPSIIVGVFVYAILVRTLGNFSAYAGAAALAILMIPIVTRTTEEMLRLVPNTMREAALAMGAPRWRVIFGVLMRSARSGMLTGMLLAVARVSGETAPLLFTSLNNPYWVNTDSVSGFAGSLNQPTANLTVSIFNQAMSPFENWQQMAWGAALLITMAVLFVTIMSRIVLRPKGVRA